jgi:hypothetical protein
VSNAVFRPESTADESDFPVKRCAGVGSIESRGRYRKARRRIEHDSFTYDGRSKVPKTCSRIFSWFTAPPGDGGVDRGV